jgi:hypothetical protein
MQDHALCRKFLLDRTRHVSSSFDLTSTRYTPDQVRFASRIAQSHACQRGIGAASRSRQRFMGKDAEKHVVRPEFVLFREVALVAAQYGGH